MRQPQRRAAVLCALGRSRLGHRAEGKGQIWRVRYEDGAAQPVIAWRESAGELRIAFDRPLPPDWKPGGASISTGPHTRAGDRFETMRPPYEVVKRQQADGVRGLEVTEMTTDGTLLTIKHAELDDATWLGIDVPGGYSLQSDSSGVIAEWQENGDGAAVTRRLPHIDLAVARELTKPSAHFAAFHQAGAGTLKLRTQLDLWQMLRPAVQRGARLDYEYAPERVTVTFASSTTPFELIHAGEHLKSTRGHVSHDVSISVTPEENRWLPIEIMMAHGSDQLPELTAYWSTAEDPRHRALQTRRFLMPWAKPVAASESRLPVRPEIQGGDWAKGKALFFSAKTNCSTCHQRDGEGEHIGPDLSSLPHRDYALGPPRHPAAIGLDQPRLPDPRGGADQR